MAQVIGVLEQGFIYAILALGVYITFRILDFPDMSVDATFPLGAAVTAVMISNGFHPWLALPVSLLCGAAAGAITGLIHVRLHVRDLLSGIIVMTGLYSINLHIAGRANVPLFTFDTMFKNSFVSGLSPQLQTYFPVILLFLLAVFCKIVMDLYLSTRSGFLLKATGDNPTLVASLAEDSGKVKILGLSIANALVALAGSILVLAVASVILGMQLLRGLRRLRATTAVIIGSVLYKACVALALSLGLSPFDLKLITAALLLIIIVIGGKNRKVKTHA